MLNKFYSILMVCLCLSPIMGLGFVYGQANRSNSGDVTCPASGSSIQILPQRSSRYSMLFNNVNGVAIRLGYLDSGTATLDSTNSWILQPGQATGDSLPGILNKRVVCMSTTAVSNTISFNETFR